MVFPIGISIATEVLHGSNSIGLLDVALLLLEPIGAAVSIDWPKWFRRYTVCVLCMKTTEFYVDLCSFRHDGYHLPSSTKPVQANVTYT